MRIDTIKTNPGNYSSKVYLIRGDFNALDDLNTLIDTGADSYIIHEIAKISTGVGKKPVEQVVLTHNHFDHTGGIKSLKAAFQPAILAYGNEEYVTRKLNDNDILKIGDQIFYVIYSPGHSNDSICLYNLEHRVLFSGDTTLDIKSPGGSYSPAFVETLERLASLKIDCIFPGHGQPVTENCEIIIKNTLKIVKSGIIN